MFLSFTNQPHPNLVGHNLHFAFPEESYGLKSRVNKLLAIILRKLDGTDIFLRLHLNFLLLLALASLNRRQVPKREYKKVLLDL